MTEHDKLHITNEGLCVCKCSLCRNHLGECICFDDCYIHHGVWEGELPDEADEMVVKFNEEKNEYQTNT